MSSGSLSSKQVVQLKQGIGSTYLLSAWNSSTSTNEWTYYNLGVYRHSRVINGRLLENNNLTIREIIED